MFSQSGFIPLKPSRKRTKNHQHEIGMEMTKQLVKKSVFRRNMFIGSILLVSAMAICGVGDSGDEVKLSTRQVYAELVKSKAYPEPVEQAVSEILSSSLSFGMYEFNEVNIAIEQNCMGDSWTWKDTLKAFPARMALYVLRFSMNILLKPEQAIKIQINNAYTCEGKSVFDVQ